MIKKNLICYLMALSFYAHKSSFSLDGQNILENICKTITITQFSEDDFPDEKESEELQGCVSKKYYYGIGAPINYVKARKCAFLEMNARDENPFSGSLILMMIYANGLGVKRDLNLATNIACSLNNTETETKERVLYLRSFQDQNENIKFDICDNVSSSYMQAECAKKENEIVSTKKENNLTHHDLKNLTVRQRHAFQNLNEVAKTFFTARLKNELNLNGATHEAKQAKEETKLKSIFANSIFKFEKGQHPHFTKKEYSKLNKDLNKLMAKILRKDQLQPSITTNKKGIKFTQKNWNKYKDAWLKFTALRYPNINAVNWKAWLVEERIKQLKKIL